MKRGSFWPTATIGAAAGAAAVYLFDPERGRTRRAKLADQVGAAMRKAGREMRAQARYQQGVAKGILHDVADPFRPETQVDDVTLLQKIRSEAVGHWNGPKQDLEIDVRDGMVTLRGHALQGDAEELIDLVESVDGVRGITDQLNVTQGA